MFASLEHRLLMVHVPRTGGTALKRGLARAVSGAEQNWRAYGFRCYGSRYPTHSYGRQIAADLPDLWSFCFRFGIVRHPIDRLVSLYKVCQADGRARFSGVNRGKDSDKEHWAGLAEGLSFENWLINWCHDCGWNPWPETRVHGESIVDVPQSRWLCNEAGQLIVHRVFRLNEGSVIQAAMEGRISRPVVFPRANESANKDPVVRTDAVEKWARSALADDFVRWGF